MQYEGVGIDEALRQIHCKTMIRPIRQLERVFRGLNEFVEYGSIPHNQLIKELNYLFCGDPKPLKSEDLKTLISSLDVIGTEIRSRKNGEVWHPEKESLPQFRYRLPDFSIDPDTPHGITEKQIVAAMGIQ